MAGPHEAPVSCEDDLDSLFGTNWNDDHELLDLQSPKDLPDDFDFGFDAPSPAVFPAEAAADAPTGDAAPLSPPQELRLTLPLNVEELIPGLATDPGATGTGLSAPAMAGLQMQYPDPFMALPDMPLMGPMFTAPVNDFPVYAEQFMPPAMEPRTQGMGSLRLPSSTLTLPNSVLTLPNSTLTLPNSTLALPAVDLGLDYLNPDPMDAPPRNPTRPRQRNRPSGGKFEGAQYSLPGYRNSSGEDSLSPLEDRKRVDHRRERKRNPSNDAKTFYKAPKPSQAWGRLAKSGNPLFEYNPKHIELNMYGRYSREELRQFFMGDGAPGNQPPNRSCLTLWIQNPPAQVNQRYHSGSASSKCRWKNCPDPKNTILKGFWRVAFDENSDRSGTDVDPFLNAGYMHLFCLEQAFDLVELIYLGERTGAFRVRPDVRDFVKETRNPMSMTRDHRDLLRVFKHWRKTQLERHFNHCKAFRQSYPGLRVPRRKYNADDCLWRALTDAHLKLEVRGRHQTRETRDGADIAKHRGDLILYLDLKRDRVEALRALEDEDDEGDEPVLPPHGEKRKQSEYAQDYEQAGGGYPGYAVADYTRKRRRVQPERVVKSPTLAEQFPAMARYGLAAAPPSSPRTPKRSGSIMNLTMPSSSLEDLGHVIEELQHRPATRKCSREVAQLIEREATGPNHLTRRRSQQLGPLLLDQPPHIRQQLEKIVGPDLPLISPRQMDILSSLPPSRKRKVRTFLEREIEAKRRHMSS